MDITRKHCQKHGNIINGAEANIRQLLKLRGSRTMQNTGDVFDGKRIVLDEGTGICYRKEQFFLQDRLPVEYIIRDRRYTKESIFDLVEKAGFFVEKYYCFQAGRMDEPLHELNEKAKEIIVIARKAPWYAAFYQRLIHSEYWNRLFVKLKKE